MMWITLVVISAVILGIYEICNKHAVHQNAVMPPLFLGTASGTLVVVLALLAKGQLGFYADVGWVVWLQILLKSGIVTCSWICGYYAMRSLPISIASPIASTQPAWVLVGALLVFSERLTALQWVGIGVIFSGYYFFSMAGKQEGIHFQKHKGIPLIFAATMLGGVSGLYDKYLLQPQHLAPMSVQLWFQVNLVLLIGAAWLIQRGLGLARSPFVWRWSIPIMGLMLSASDWCYFTALSDPHAKISIISAMRRSNCVISFVIGGLLFQDQNKRRKAAALVFVILGVILLCLANLN